MPEAPRPAPAAAPSMQERIGRFDPQAAELSGLLKERLAVPGLVAAGIAGSLSAAIVLAAGLLIAVITPDTFIIGAAGVDANIITEGFRQAVGTLLTPMLDPGLIIGGSQTDPPADPRRDPAHRPRPHDAPRAQRTEGAPPLQRIGWALAVAGPFGLWMLVFAIIGGNSATTNIDVSAGNAFALGILWGLVGGFIGAVTKIPLGTAIKAVPAPVARQR